VPWKKGKRDYDFLLIIFVASIVNGIHQQAKKPEADMLKQPVLDNSGHRKGSLIKLIKPALGAG